jgi:hypothetical protein
MKVLSSCAGTSQYRLDSYKCDTFHIKLKLGKKKIEGQNMNAKVNWKGWGRKQSWHNLIYYPRICLSELRKATKTLRIAGVPAESLTGHLPITSQKSYCFSQLAW